MSFTLTFATSRDAWVWLARFAYRRAARATGEAPVGIPHMRDPDAICTGYAPRKWQSGDYENCDTDGHYLCDECCHKARPR